MSKAKDYYKEVLRLQQALSYYRVDNQPNSIFLQNKLETCRIEIGFTEKMTLAKNALQSKNYAAALKYTGEALQLKPDDGQASQILNKLREKEQQRLHNQQLRRFQYLLSQAEESVQKGEWIRAKKHYQETINAHKTGFQPNRQTLQNNIIECQKKLDLEKSKLVAEQNAQKSKPKEEYEQKSKPKEEYEQKSKLKEEYEQKSKLKEEYEQKSKLKEEYEQKLKPKEEYGQKLKTNEGFKYYFLFLGLVFGLFFGLLVSALFSGGEGIQRFFSDLTLAGVGTGLMGGFIKHKVAKRNFYLSFTILAGVAAFLPSAIKSGLYIDDTFTGALVGLFIGLLINTVGKKRATRS